MVVVGIQLTYRAQLRFASLHSDLTDTAPACPPFIYKNTEGSNSQQQLCRCCCWTRQQLALHWGHHCHGSCSPCFFTDYKTPAPLSIREGYQICEQQGTCKARGALAGLSCSTECARQVELKSCVKDALVLISHVTDAQSTAGVCSKTLR